MIGAFLCCPKPAKLALHPRNANALDNAKIHQTVSSELTPRELHPNCRSDNHGRAVSVSYVVGNDKYGACTALLRADNGVKFCVVDVTTLNNSIHSYHQQADQEQAAYTLRLERS